MQESETLQLLSLTHNIWQEQTTDAMTQAVWHEMLKPLTYSSCRQAIFEIARQGKPRPTCGEIYHIALELEEIAAERARNSRRALPEPERTAEEITRAQEFFSGLVTKLAARWSG